MTSAAFDCRTCGACCSFSAEWPRFTLESDEDLALIAPELVADDLSGMRCEGERCVALAGRIGDETGCRIYPHRPLVCRDCLPGDPECLDARRAFGLPVGGAVASS